MKFLDKLNEMTEKAVKSVEDTKNKVNDFYKKEGLEGILDRADKGMDNLEKNLGKVADKTTTYIKGVKRSNTIKMEEAKRDSKDEFDAVINSGLAATINTVSTVAKDVAKKAKDFVSSKESAPSMQSSPEKKNAFEEFRFKQADNVSLETVLKFVGAKEDPSINNNFKDSHGNTISIVKNMWHNWNTSKGGVGAVSLLSYQLDTSYNSQVPNKVSQEDIKKEAINVLDQLSLRQEVLEKEIKENAKKSESEYEELSKQVPTKKVPVKKTPAKKVATRKMEPLTTPKVSVKKIKPIAAKKSLKK